MSKVLVIIKHGLGNYSHDIETHPDAATAREVAYQLNKEKREPGYNIVAINLSHDLSHEN